MDPHSLPSVPHPINELRDLKAAIDKSAIVAITDPKGNIIHVNDKFCEISKYSREELLGQNHRLINSGYHPPEFFIDLWKTISKGHIWKGEVKNRAKDGSHYWVDTTIVPFLDEHHLPYQYVSIRFEITQRKMFEEQLERSNQELQHFASIAAHDLQEPLRKILAFSDRLQTKYSDQLQDEAKDYFNRIVSAASRMRALIDDLLTYSRVTSKPLPPETVDLNEVVRNVLSDLEIRIEQTKAKIQVHPLPKIIGDGTQMHQLFQNLITNGLKFHQPGTTPEITISAYPQGEWFTIEFKDRGIGFENQYADRIFAIFQRLHGRQQFEGTGVGLAVCRKIVERHNGEIYAEGVPGEGSTFYVRLPVQRIKEEIKL